ncbi:MAG: hypothetical protein NTZ68_03220 [Candidatus Dependentiae bacterium]|nr:hypothetical protein [Candidatus Dependentiae bacterium]
MCSKRSLLFILCSMPFMMRAESVLDTFKGIGSAIESFPLFKASTWEGMGKAFGAPPTGYVYSFSVYNDSPLPVYIGMQRLVSIMGGTFPRAQGWSWIPNETGIAPFSSYKTLTPVDYYFELFIQSLPTEPSNHMPYQMYPYVLYLQDVIQLQEKHSTTMNYFRTYMGKELQNGAYVHRLKAEYLGGYTPQAAGSKADPGVTMSSNLSALTLRNSTDQDYYVGYINQANATTMTQSTCQFFALVCKDSFALYNAASGSSMLPGTIGLFDATTKQLLKTYSLPTQIFDGKTYVLEIYQDAGKPLSMDMQGIMPGNYDVAMGRICDITPVSCVLWFQSIAQLKSQQKSLTPSNYVDLPGKVWIVSFLTSATTNTNQQILGNVAVGSAGQFIITRPQVEKKLQLYFIYVDEIDDAKAQVFIQNFMSGTIGSDMTTLYQQQSVQQMKYAKAHQLAQAVTKGSTAPTPQASQALLQQAIAGALTLNQGQIKDPSSGITGYLLGGDVFLPQGVGSTNNYYQLNPSLTNAENIPNGAVSNLYASTLSGTAPVGMPAPTAALAINTTPAAPTQVATSAASVATPAVSAAKKTSSGSKKKANK